MSYFFNSTQTKLFVRYNFKDVKSDKDMLVIKQFEVNDNEDAKAFVVATMATTTDTNRWAGVKQLQDCGLIAEVVL